MSGQQQFNKLSATFGAGLTHFIHASDTTGTRNAGYYAYVSVINNVYYATTGYGALGTTYRENKLGAFADETKAKDEANKAMHKKLSKNYVVDFDMKTGAVGTTPVPKKKPEPLFPFDIKRLSTDIYSMKEEPHRQDWITSAFYNMEWYPNLTKLQLLMLKRSGYAIYNISGDRVDTFTYPSYVDKESAEFKDIIGNGLMFRCYTDENNNVCILSYLRYHAAIGTTQFSVPTYAEQRNISMLILDIMYGRDNVDIFDKTRALYLNQAITRADDKSKAVLGREKPNRFAYNLAVFHPTDSLAHITTAERINT